MNPNGLTMQALGILILSIKLLSIPNNGTDNRIMIHPTINTYVRATPVSTNTLNKVKT